MEISFSEKSQQFKAGIFAVLNEKKMELEKAGKLKAVLRKTAFISGDSF